MVRFFRFLLELLDDDEDDDLLISTGLSAECDAPSSASRAFVFSLLSATAPVTRFCSSRSLSAGLIKELLSGL